jgi:hypothetical protein
LDGHPLCFLARARAHLRVVRLEIRRVVAAALGPRSIVTDPQRSQSRPGHRKPEPPTSTLPGRHGRVRGGSVPIRTPLTAVLDRRKLRLSTANGANCKQNCSHGDRSICHLTDRRLDGDTHNSADLGEVRADRLRSCGVCGLKMHTKPRGGGSGDAYTRYVCTKRRIEGPDDCGRGSRSIAPGDYLLSEAAMMRLDSPELGTALNGNDEEKAGRMTELLEQH